MWTPSSELGAGAAGEGKPDLTLAKPHTFQTPAVCSRTIPLLWNDRSSTTTVLGSTFNGNVALKHARKVVGVVSEGVQFLLSGGYLEATFEYAAQDGVKPVVGLNERWQARHPSLR